MSGDAFLVDGIAFWRNEGTGSARSANDIEIEDGIILVHVFGEEDVPGLRLRYGLSIEFGRTGKKHPTRLEHFSQNSPIKRRPVRILTLNPVTRYIVDRTCCG